MPRLERERAAKLALLEALASSQRAVARMLESTAELHANFPGEKPEDAAAMLARLAGLQLRMCESLLGVKLRRVMRGNPGAPWLMAGRLRARNGEGVEAGNGGCCGMTTGKNRRAAAGKSLRVSVDNRRCEAAGKSLRVSVDNRRCEAAGNRRYASAGGRLTDGRKTE